MNKIYLSIIITAFSINLFCQADSLIVLDSTYSYTWDETANDWVYSSKSIYYWSELTVSQSQNMMELNCMIYPNPTREIITIETDRVDHYSIHITSLNAQFIYGAEMNGTSHQVDLSSFENGIYIITIRSKESVTTRKIVKL